MIGHLGTRVTALLDGRLDAAEEERAWQHVHSCTHCRDQVEREGWVKTQLAGLGLTAHDDAPEGLRETLLRAPVTAGGPSGAELLATAGTSTRPHRRIGLVAAGGTAIGAAVLGMLAVAAGPAEAPVPDRRVPATDLARQIGLHGPRVPVTRPATTPGTMPAQRTPRPTDDELMSRR